MCDRCEKTEVHLEAPPTKSKRVWLWDAVDSIHCAVIGTCLSHSDLLGLTRRLKLKVDEGCKDYDLHSYFVNAAIKKSPEAKAIHKLLDERYAGQLRKFKRLHDDEEITDLWNEQKEAGQIAGAFYALLTLSHISREVRGVVFGEVHMLSHLMGASYRLQSVEVALLKSKLDDLSTRRSRVESGLHDALQERDQTIAKLEQQVQELKAKVLSTPVASEGSKRTVNIEKRDRAIEVARARARLAEGQLEATNLKLREYRSKLYRLQRKASDDKANLMEAQEMPRLDGRSILYVGGRPSQIPHLEKAAENFGAKFIHHDGGKEHAITRIDEVLSSVDCVFCPVNHVSHDACLRVKAGCKKLGKSFIPLRSSSQTSLHHALLSWEC